MNQKLIRYIRSHKRLLAIAKTVKHSLRRQRDWRFITFEEGFALASDWVDKLPKNFDIVVGVPRSGLLIANVLASKMGKPLSTADDFVRGVVWSSRDAVKPVDYVRVLLVEDSISSGRSMQDDADKLKRFNPNLEIKKASLFVNAKSRGLVDYFYAFMNSPMPLEWNLLSSLGKWVGKVAVDFDGVLCDDSGGALLIPAFQIEAIVTARLESERALTEAWLKDNGVHYNRLIMFNGEAYQRTLKNLSKYKAEHALAVGAVWFWESDPELAKEIARLMQKPVYCPTIHRVISPRTQI